MKNLLQIALVTLFSISSADAKIWRVNNNPGVSADFTSVQAAHDGASTGDTIHIEPSLTNYGDLNMTKRLVVISIGYFLAENPNIQFDPKIPFINTVNINNTNANNSVLMVRFAGNININSGVSGVVISNSVSTTSNGNTNCTVGQVIVNNADNVTIRNSWVSNIQVQNGSNNVLILNNIIGNAVGVEINSDGSITNNVIHAMDGGACGANDLSINNCVVGNNIFNSQQNATFFNCNVSNNLAPNANLPAGNGNLTNVNMSTVFVNNTGGFVDNVYQLKQGSPAIGAGAGGIDCGAFGGGTPFKLGVTPPIPSIYKMMIPASPSGSTMTLTFSTRSNN